ncbi:MAG TPA: serine/threonine-protein kinase [Anaeromyxobacteraceae bacterium]|nr:serine/threonine-protein kinase [Anaeromyxobacteraceae bacterium]
MLPGATSPETSPGHPIGQLVGVIANYELVREVGRDEFGMIWEAREVRSHHPVSVKVFRTESRPGARRPRGEGDRRAPTAELELGDLVHSAAHGPCRLAGNVVRKTREGNREFVGLRRCDDHAVVLVPVEQLPALELMRRASGARLSTEHLEILSHRNIATFHAYRYVLGGQVLVIEPLRGCTLAKRLERGPLPFPEALRIAVAVTGGLAHAHRKGFSHRKLTPFDVLLWDDGPVKLDVGTGGTLWSQQIVRGSAPYMAPEQWQGVLGDKRSDVFTLGVIVFKMLSGSLPFPDDGGTAIQGPNPAPALQFAASTTPTGLRPLLEAIDAGASAGLESQQLQGALERLGKLVAQMLEKDPDRRPRNAATLLPSLVAVQRAVAAAPSSMTEAVLVTSLDCARFAEVLEELAFRGESPAGSVRDHLAACTSCTQRWERERALYAMPSELSNRVLAMAAGESPRTDMPDTTCDDTARPPTALRGVFGSRRKKATPAPRRRNR